MREKTGKKLLMGLRCGLRPGRGTSVRVRMVMPGFVRAKAPSMARSVLERADIVFAFDVS